MNNYQFQNIEKRIPKDEWYRIYKYPIEDIISNYTELIQYCMYNNYYKRDLIQWTKIHRKYESTMTFNEEIFRYQMINYLYYNSTNAFIQ
jgi:hypothetical protein